MNNYQGNPQRRPSAPSGKRPRGQRPMTQGRPVNRGQAPQRPAPQNRPQQPGRRPPVQNSYRGTGRRSGLSNEALALILVILAVILVALIVTFIIIKNTDKTDNDTGDGTSDPSVQAGLNDPSGSRPEWNPYVEDPKAFIPLSDASTHTLSKSEVYSKNIIMVDLSTNKVVCQLGADTKIFPASLTKVMTVIVACELIGDMNDTTTIPGNVIDSLKAAKASRAYLAPDTPYTMQDLIYGAMLPSGADACYGLATHLAGSEEAFVSL